MNYQRLAMALLVVLGASFPASAQSVISTHSGLVYFFEGAVWLGDQPLEQKFGKFPDIGEGRELRTEEGRAEVLLTPGVFLRLAEHGKIRLISSNLADTRVELLAGSAIVETRDASTDTSATVMYKGWRIKVPQRGIYRIDSVPPQVKVYKGEAEVLVDGNQEPVSVKDGQMLPLSQVLVAEAEPPELGDGFEKWAIERSQVVYADNATAAEILDDPALTDSAGLALGGLTYFPMTSSPALGLANPYGLSFWSPFQPSLSSMYLLGSPIGWAYPAYPGNRLFQLYPLRPLRPLRPGSPTIGTLPGFRPTTGTVGAYHPVGGTTTGPAPARIPLPATAPARGTSSRPAIGVHGGHR